MTDGPVSYWRLGETSGTLAADSADGNTGTITGGVTLGVPGAIVNDSNTAMTFDGVTGAVMVPDKANLDIQGDLTIEGWANPARMSTGYDIFAGKGRYEYRLGLYGNQWRGNVFFQGKSFSVVAKTPAITGQWAYIVMTRRGTLLTLYVNGTAVATKTVPAGLIDTSTIPFAIGRKSSSTGNLFSGSVDEVAVYNKALTPNRIMAHYQAGQAIAAAKLKSPLKMTSTLTPTSTLPLKMTPTLALRLAPTLPPTFQP